MILRIDTSNSIPVYAQIVDQVKRAIASGALKTGDSLPSLRETSVKLRVNPLTVGKAYKQLEQEGLIETRHGLGSYVTTTAENAVGDYRREVLSQQIDYLLVDACHLGVSFDSLKELIDERVESANNGFARNTDTKDGGNDNGE